MGCDLFAVDDKEIALTSYMGVEGRVRDCATEDRNVKTIDLDCG